MAQISLFMLVLVALDGYNFILRYAMYQQAGLLAVVSLLCFLFFSFFKFSFSCFNTLQLWPCAISFVLAYMFLIIGRKFFLKMLNHDNLRERVLLIGNGWMGQAIAKALKQREFMGWEFIGFVALQGGKDQDQAAGEVVACLEQLDDIVQDKDVTTIVDTRAAVIDLKPGRRSKKGWAGSCNLKFECSLKIMDGQDFYEALTRRIPLPEDSSSQDDYSLSISAKPHVHQLIRHIYNLALAITLLVVSLPLWLLISAAIKLEDGGPVFYTGERIGYLGRPFKLIKFRTMLTNADDLICFNGLPAHDCVTRLGRFLRKTRLDELPQLLNILKRDINLVGPRPFVHREVESFKREIPYFEKRYLIRPGITGMAQVLYCYENNLEDAKIKLQYDFYYVKNSGFFLDLLIMLWTAVSMLSFKGR